MQIHKEAIAIYDGIKKSDYPIFKHKVKIRAQFDQSPKVTIDFGDFNLEPYTVHIKDASGSVIFSSQIITGHFCYAYRRWIDDITIFVYDKNGDQVHEFNLLKKIRSGKVMIALGSSSLGDTLAWVPYVNRFAEVHNCSDITITTFWNHLFEGQYDVLKFKNPGYREDNIDVLVGVGWYQETDINYHKVDPRLCPLQKVASDMLGLEYIGEIKPRLKKTIKGKPSDKKYICIGTESTAAAKHWNYPGGWQQLINLFKNIGYEVVIIHKQENHFSNVIDKTGDRPIEDRISDILNCEFFVGVGSGLSWLSWGLDVPVVMISGFSQPFCEFTDKTLRIINTDVCHGCFNRVEHKFDKGDWWWCPEHKDTDRHFECTKSITPEHVFQSVIEWTTKEA
jgi:autotransporter strand-loop-strand O-heptosyltransferase